MYLLLLSNDLWLFFISAVAGIPYDEAIPAVASIPTIDVVPSQAVHFCCLQPCSAAVVSDVLHFLVSMLLLVTLLI